MSDREQPARYGRTTGGLITSLVVTVAAVLALLGFMRLFRHDYHDKPPDLPYLEQADALQRNGFPAVYPARLPDGWIMRNVVYEPDQGPSWELAMLTDDDRFVGMYQARASATALLADHVDENPRRGDVLEVDGSVAPRWRAWSDDGGDHAYTAKVGDYTVMVYGSAPLEDLQTVVGSLTDAPPEPTISTGPTTAVSPSAPAPSR